MESAAVLRSFQFAVSTSSHLKSVLERPGMISVNNTALCNLSQMPVYGGKTVSSTNRRGSLLVSCVKTPEATVTAKSKGNSNGAVLSDGQRNGLLEKKSPISATFPTGFEALLSEVCDDTKITELKVKYGAFEIHMKRSIGGPTVPAPVVSQPAVPPVPSEPANESISDVPSSPPKSSAEKVTPFSNVSVENAARLASLEAFGSSGYVIVSSPTVGSFQRARIRKGHKGQPACKEGDIIKVGQVICFLDQFGTQFPVKSNVDGEVLKFLYSDGEAVGYGDPLLAVLPSFHDIK